MASSSVTEEKVFNADCRMVNIVRQVQVSSSSKTMCRQGTLTEGEGSVQLTSLY